VLNASESAIISAKYPGKAREVMELLLDKYADHGITALEDPDMLKIIPMILGYGTDLER